MFINKVGENNYIIKKLNIKFGKNIYGVYIIFCFKKLYEIYNVDKSLKK